MEFGLILSLTGSVLYWNVSIDPKVKGGRFHPSATYGVTFQKKNVLCIFTAMSELLFVEDCCRLQAKNSSLEKKCKQPRLK